MPGDAQKGTEETRLGKKDAKAGAMQKGEHVRLIVWWSCWRCKNKKTKINRKEKEKKKKRKKQNKKKKRDLGFDMLHFKNGRLRPGCIVNYFFLSKESLSSLVHSSPVIF